MAEQKPRFTDEERAAIRDRADELKTSARKGPRKADGERDVLAKIDEMSEPDRTMAQRLHAIAPALLEGALDVVFGDEAGDRLRDRFRHRHRLDQIGRGFGEGFALGRIGRHRDDR